MWDLESSVLWQRSAPRPQLNLEMPLSQLSEPLPSSSSSSWTGRRMFLAITCLPGTSLEIFSIENCTQSGRYVNPRLYICSVQRLSGLSRANMRPWEFLTRKAKRTKQSLRYLYTVYPRGITIAHTWTLRSPAIDGRTPLISSPVQTITRLPNCLYWPEVCVVLALDRNAHCMLIVCSLYALHGLRSG